MPYEVMANFKGRGWETIDRAESVSESLILAFKYLLIFSNNWQLALFREGERLPFSFIGCLPNSESESS